MEFLVYSFCHYHFILFVGGEFHRCFSVYGQFDDIGHHGTKVIIYNLWFNDEGTMELDFESDLEVGFSSFLTQLPVWNLPTHHSQ